jgi:hypothetical protein
MSKLSEGLDGLAQYMGIKPLEAKQVVIRKPYIAPSMTIKSQYVAPETNVVSNFIGPDMGPGIYGYHVSTNE